MFLFENIPHKKLKNVMKKLISFSFKGGKKQFIAATKFDVTWTDNKNKLNITFDKASLKRAVIFLLDNCFYNFGDLLFRQKNLKVQKFENFNIQL